MGIKPSIEILENILVLKLSGARTLYDVDDINELLVKELQKSNSKKAVIDYTGVKGKRSIVESVQKAESFPVEFRQYKIALIDSKENREAAVAEESVFSNRGFRLKAFTDLQEAIKWLKSFITE